MGPLVVGGVTNYPAHPGATYHNSPVEYTTNPPAAGVRAFVTVYSTNSFVPVHLTDGNTRTNLETVPK